VTAFGAFGILLSFLSMAIVWRQLTINRLLVCTLLMILHIFAAVDYYQFSLTAVADSSQYYFDYYHLSTHRFELGTVGLLNLVQVLKSNGATYLDCFMLFQVFGFAGMMIMVRVFQDIEAYVQVPEGRSYLILLFLPTLNFWTAAIGKDAPLFFAISLCTFAMLSLRKRLFLFCLSLSVMVLFRAHIALMAATALAGAAIFERSVSTGRKLALFAFALLGIWFTAGAVQTTFGVDATSVSDVSDFLNTHNGINATQGGTTAMGDAPIPVRVVSLLFRPLFFDAHGLMGIVPSFENVGVIIAFIYVIVHWRDVALLARRVFFIRFALFFAFMILLGLTLIYYNVGLGLRERIMSFPMIFSLLVALWSMRRKRAAPPVQQMHPSLLVGDNRNRAVPGM
jgi:hypothetical protein